MARWWFLIVALIVSVAACQQEGEQVGTTEEESTAVVVNPAEVEDHIRTSSDRFEQAMLAGDTETLTAFYADDAVILPPGTTRTEGIDAIRSTWQEMTATGNPTEFTLDPQTIEVSESGDMAYEIGTYTWTGPGPDGATMSDTGKYVVVWEPTETGEWKIAVDTWNSDMMPGQNPGATPSNAPSDTQAAPTTGQ